MSLVGQQVTVRTHDWQTFTGTLIEFLHENELIQIQLENNGGLLILPLRNLSYIREGLVKEPQYSAGNYPDTPFVQKKNNKPQGTLL